MREDRSPGGKHRHKRQRLDEGGSGEALEDGGNMLSAEDEMRDQLVAAKPQLYPKTENDEGMRLGFFRSTVNS